MGRSRAIGLATAAGAAVLLALLFHPPAPPWSRTLHVSLQAASFGELNPAATVELAGTRIGTVEGLELRDGRPLVRLSIDPAYADLLHADASAAIRPHGLLGPRYVDLGGGTRGRLVDGATIPISRVRVSTDLDQVLDVVQPDVRQSLRTLIDELGTAGDGRGQDVNAALRSLGEATDDVATVAATLHRRDGDLAGTVVASEQLDRDLQDAPLGAQVRDTLRVLSGLVQVDASIGDGIDHTAELLEALDVVLDGNSENLARTLDQAPGTVTRLRAALVPATGLVNGVNPALPALMTAIVETRSAFSGSDASGHFVRVMALSGTCTIGLNAGCASPGPGQASQPAGAEAPAQAPPRSRLDDRELMRLFLGD
jgi:phospholipid/cholesterol/gamma-HCH transport system substrate-binding protein